MRLRAGPPRPPLPSPSLLLLLLLCSASRSASRSVQWSNDAPSLMLIEHVLNNDLQWRPVLEQAIKVTDRNRPPYHRNDDAVMADPEVRALLWLLDKDAVQVTPLPVIQKVATLRWLGSYVEYAAYVTRTAFMCYTYSNVVLLLQLVLIMWDKSAAAATARGEAAPETAVAAVSDGFPENAIRDMVATVSQFVSKMAAVHSDLSAMADLLFENANATYAVPEAHYQTLHLVHDMIDRQVDARCVKTPGHYDAFKHLGFRGAKGSLDSPATSLEAVVQTFERTVERALHVYEDFNVEAMPLENWRAVLDYETPVIKCADPYINVLPEIDQFERMTNSRTRAKKEKQLASRSSVVQDDSSK